jgi:UDP-2,4-diacetamido-2,4,6-trideoxy-beta-L-altropyranose hydrolase
MRCLTLANTLAVKGENCIFVSADTPPVLADLVKRSGHQLALLEKGKFKNISKSKYASWLGSSLDEDAIRTSELANKLEVDWIVVDHYAIDISWENLLSASGRKIAVIDDLADRKHNCQLLLDQNLHEYPLDRYKLLVPKNCKLLLGPYYALLRPEFSQLRTHSRKFDRNIVTYLVAFSGLDAGRIAKTALESLKGICRTTDRVIVALNSNNMELPFIQSFCMENCYELHIDAVNMAELMAGADISVGAGGGMLWERATLGLPSISIAVVENQRQQVIRAAEMGMVLGCDQSEISVVRLREMVLQLRDDCTSRSTMSNICRTIVDGLGTERVASSILTNQVIL